MMKRAIMLCAIGIGGFMPFFAHAAQIYLDPPKGSYAPGVTFPVAVRIDTTASQCINAAEVDISYPKDLMTAVAVNDGNSIFSLWVKEPTIYSQYGLISFVGGLPGGYCGRVPGDPSLSNLLATIYFEFPTSTAANSSTLPQTAHVAFLSSTKAMLNDGQGTDAPLSTAGASFTQILTGSYAPVDAWAQAIENDTTPPEPFTVGIYRDPSLFNDQWFATFSTVDNQTGIDHYDVAEVPPSELSQPPSQWDWHRAVSPYLIGDQGLTDTIAVRAIDMAGNIRMEEYTPTSTVPAIPGTNLSMFPYIALIGIVGVALLQLILRIFL